MILSSSRRHRTSKRIWIRFIKCTKTWQVRRVSWKLTYRSQRESLLAKKRSVPNWRTRSKTRDKNNRIIWTLLSNSNRNSSRYRASPSNSPSSLVLAAIRLKATQSGFTEVAVRERPSEVVAERSKLRGYQITNEPRSDIVDYYCKTVL